MLTNIQTTGKIANVIYANRMDNGDTDSVTGGHSWWRHSTHRRYNYTKFAKEMDMSAEEAVDYVRTKKGALDSACWFWDTNGLNKYCDAMDIVGATKRINGGTIGLDDRKKHYLHAMDVLGGDFEEPEVDYNQTIRQGSRGTISCRGTRKT